MIAIMCAMREELEPILEYLELKEIIEHANNKFYLAKFKNLDLVLAYSKIGKVNAALTSSILIEKFNVKKILFSGVAGAIDKDLKIGDLICLLYTSPSPRD
jgi:adenosylhomocysteine/aminodeoxyfutalosine nucleosidase